MKASDENATKIYALKQLQDHPAKAEIKSETSRICFTAPGWSDGEFPGAPQRSESAKTVSHARPRANQRTKLENMVWSRAS